MLIKVPYINQENQWPTGCEIVSAVMLLHYLNVQIEVDEFIDKYIPRRAIKFIDGVMYAANPYEYFIGSPYDEDSYGCYAPVIAKALNFLFSEKRLPYVAKNVSGLKTKELIEKYVDKGSPVIYWACIDMKPIIEGPEWVLMDTKENFMWKSNEHCMLLVGHDDKKLYFNDPWNNNGVIGYDKELAIDRHCMQMEMAVVVESD